MEKFDKYKYIYPPRPELKITPDNLNTYNNSYIAQPKLNGSNIEIYVNKSNIIQKGRHNNTLTNFNLDNREIISTLNINNNWNMFNGEYMNKSKKDKNNNIFNHKLILFDIIVYNNQYLLNKTFDDRINILYDIFNPIDEDEYLYKLSDNIYLVKSFYDNFNSLWNNIIKIDMYEGLVLKRKNGKLKRGTREKNNNLTQLKCRKPTKLYTY